MPSNAARWGPPCVSREQTWHIQSGTQQVCYETRCTKSVLEFLNIFSRLSVFIVFSCRHVVAIEVWGLGRIAISHSRVSE
jgi:hypothetical protein